MVKGRNYGSKLRKKQMRNKKGLFRPAKNKEIAEIVKIDSPENALKSCKALLSKVVQWVNCAEQRAKAQLKRKNLSAKERKEMKEVSKIYHDFKERLKGLKRSLKLR